MSRADEPAIACIVKEVREIFKDAPPQPVDVQYTGLTIREHFAAMAMMGYLGGVPGGHLVPPNLARESVAQADALLAELAKPVTP